MRVRPVHKYPFSNEFFNSVFMTDKVLQNIIVLFFSRVSFSRRKKLKGSSDWHYCDVIVLEKFRFHRPRESTKNGVFKTFRSGKRFGKVAFFSQRFHRVWTEGQYSPTWDNSRHAECHVFSKFHVLKHTFTLQKQNKLSKAHTDRINERNSNEDRYLGI